MINNANNVYNNCLCVYSCCMMIMCKYDKFICKYDNSYANLFSEVMVNIFGNLTSLVLNLKSCILFTVIELKPKYSFGKW